MHRVRGFAVVALTALLTGGVATTVVRPVEAAVQQKKQNAKEGHPVLQQSIRQLEAIKDRLQKAPTDFGGHREAAVDAITKAINELHQAEAFDKK